MAPSKNFSILNSLAKLWHIEIFPSNYVFVVVIYWLNEKIVCRFRQFQNKIFRKWWLTFSKHFCCWQWIKWKTIFIFYSYLVANLVCLAALKILTFSKVLSVLLYFLLVFSQNIYFFLCLINLGQYLFIRISENFFKYNLNLIFLGHLLFLVLFSAMLIILHFAIFSKVLLNMWSLRADVLCVTLVCDCIICVKFDKIPNNFNFQIKFHFCFYYVLIFLIEYCIIFRYVYIHIP